MQRMTLELELVTPCFLGGANPETAEWRAASVRGQLRWWFRALAGGRLGGDLAAVHRLETEVFGSTSRASALVVRTTSCPLSAPAGVQAPGRGWKAKELAELWDDSTEAPVSRLQIDANGKEIPSNPVAYLGYGPIAHDKTKRGFFTTRASFEAGTTLGLEVSWRRPPSPDARAHFDDALWAWLHLGGIGARSRRGFGSLACVHVHGDFPPDLTAAGEQSFKVHARGLLEAGTSATSLAEWTHFTAVSRIVLGSQKCANGTEALGQLGAWLMSYRRRYGADLDARTMPDGTTPVAGRDYAWAKLAGVAGTDPLPDRVGFGLPLSFSKQGSKVAVARSGTVPITDGRPEDPRRASPLLGSIVKLGKGDFRPVLTFLPARFLPEDRQLALCRVDPQGRAHPPILHGKIDGPNADQAQIPGRFLAALLTAKLAEEVS